MHLHFNTRLGDWISGIVKMGQLCENFYLLYFFFCSDKSMARKYNEGNQVLLLKLRPAITKNVTKCITWCCYCETLNHDVSQIHSLPSKFGIHLTHHIHVRVAGDGTNSSLVIQGVRQYAIFPIFSNWFLKYSQNKVFCLKENFLTIPCYITI